MNWYSFLKLGSEDIFYLYHGTSEGAFRRIREEGLRPLNGGVWFSSDFSYALSFSIRKGSFEPRVFRIVRTPDIVPDSRILYPGDFVTDRVILPSELELYVGGVWVSLTGYYDIERNIMPL